MSFNNCILCGKYRKKCLTRTTFHKFPMDLQLQNLWIKACNLDRSFDVSTRAICSDHFHKSDYVNGHSIGNKSLVLKKYSIPSRKIPFPPDAKAAAELEIAKAEYLENVQALSQPITKKVFLPTPQFLIMPTSELQNKDPLSLAADKSENSLNVTSLPIKSETNADEKSEENTLNDVDFHEDLEKTAVGSDPLTISTVFIKNEKNEDLEMTDKDQQVIANTEIKTEKDDLSEEDSEVNTDPKTNKRKAAFPRSISMLDVSHFQTPNQIRLNLQMIKMEAKQKLKKIESLQRTNRSIVDKVLAFQNIIEQYRKNNLLSIETEVMLKAQIHRILKVDEKETSKIV